MALHRPSDKLRYVTIRILTSTNHDTNWSGAGTGFLFMARSGDKQAPLLVTNKHVVDGAKTVGITFHETRDGNETPVVGPGRLVAIAAEHLLILRHQDDGVDLAAIALAGVLEYMINKEKWHPFLMCFDSSVYPSGDAIEGMSALEEVIMVGYPTGLADPVNNFPIVRRGITATPYSTDYRGRKEFLADIPVFGGSSGSPVCIVNEGSYSTNEGIAFGQRLLLLGVLYAGHTQTINGQIVAEPVPTALVPVAKVTHMINLGICVKSALIDDLPKQIPGWD